MDKGGFAPVADGCALEPVSCDRDCVERSNDKYIRFRVKVKLSVLLANASLGCKGRGDERQVASPLTGAQDPAFLWIQGGCIETELKYCQNLWTW